MNTSKMFASTSESMTKELVFIDERSGILDDSQEMDEVKRKEKIIWLLIGAEMTAQIILV